MIHPLPPSASTRTYSRGQPLVGTRSRLRTSTSLTPSTPAIPRTGRPRAWPPSARAGSAIASGPRGVAVSTPASRIATTTTLTSLWRSLVVGWSGADDGLSAPFTLAAGIRRSPSAHGEAPLVDRGVSGSAAQYRAPTSTGVGGRGGDRNATGVAGSGNPR